MPEIYIMPIRTLYTLGEESLETASCALAASSEVVDCDRISIPCRVEYFDDLDRVVDGRSMTPEQAGNFAQFIKEREAEQIYCCCQSARSRSPAMASALNRYFGDMERSEGIWRCPQYAPNPLVFRRLCKALGVPVTDRELDRLIETNRQAFRDAIRFRW